MVYRFFSFLCVWLARDGCQQSFCFCRSLCLEEGSTLATNCCVDTWSLMMITGADFMHVNPAVTI